MHVVWEKLITDKTTKMKVTTDKNIQTHFYNRLYLSFHGCQEVELTSFTLKLHVPQQQTRLQDFFFKAMHSFAITDTCHKTQSILFVVK